MGSRAHEPDAQAWTIKRKLLALIAVSLIWAQLLVRRASRWCRRRNAMRRSSRRRSPPRRRFMAAAAARAGGGGRAQAARDALRARSD